jgi:hypothetical protein
LRDIKREENGVMPSQTYSFLSGPLGPIYVRTALPIIFVMGMNGLLTVAVALFLGHFVGPEALAAVTLMFPIYMLIVALSTLVSSGMSSILARHLGAGRMGDAQAVFAGAHGLAIVMGLILITLFLVLGRPTVLLAAGGWDILAGMGVRIPADHGALLAGALRAVGQLRCPAQRGTRRLHGDDEPSGVAGEYWLLIVTEN